MAAMATAAATATPTPIVRASCRRSTGSTPVLRKVIRSFVFILVTSAHGFGQGLQPAMDIDLHRGLRHAAALRRLGDAQTLDLHALDGAAHLVRQCVEELVQVIGAFRADM